jgi:alkylhydroperoxidase family enzyme
MRDPALEDLKRHFSEDQIVELTAVVAIANFTNRFNDALRLTPDIG